MNIQLRAYIGAVAALAAIIAALVGLIVVMPAYFEAKTYNKLTGAKATTWDAIWVELRVQDTPKR